MKGLMHYRFIKRFLASAVLLIFFGFFLLSRWNQQGFGVTSIGLIQDENKGWTVKVKRLTTGDIDETEHHTSRNKYNDENEIGQLSSPAAWIQEVLDKNLTNEETVRELLEGVDNDATLPETSNEYAAHQDVTSNSSISTERVFSRLIEPPTTVSAALLLAKKRIGTNNLRRKRKKRKRPNTIFAGFLNVHIWRAWCGSTVEDLRRNKHFPLYPDGHTSIADFFHREPAVSYGQRIFGFIHPPKTGNFTFYISSDDNSELWLSNSSSPDHIKKIAWVGNLTNSARTSIADFDVEQNQKSSEIHLTQGQMYFIEALHKQRGFSSHVLVAWKGPSLSQVKLIDSAYVSAYFDEDELSTDVNVLAEYIPETKASYPTHHHGTLEVNSRLLKNLSKFGTDDERDHFHLTPSIDDSEINGLLPKCSYNPSYLVDFEVNRYEGVYLIHETAVFPDDKTELTHMIPLTDCETRTSDSHGNRLHSDSDNDDEDFEESNESDSADYNSDNLRKTSTFGKSKNNTRTTVIGSSFDALISKLKSRFKDFNSYIRSNERIFGSQGKGLKKSANVIGNDKLDKRKLDEKVKFVELKPEIGNKTVEIDKSRRQLKKRWTSKERERSRKYVNLKGNPKVVKKNSKHHDLKRNGRKHKERQADRKVIKFAVDEDHKKKTSVDQVGTIKDDSGSENIVDRQKRGSLKKRQHKYGLNKKEGDLRNSKIVEKRDLPLDYSQNKVVNSKLVLSYKKEHLPHRAKNMQSSGNKAFKAVKKEDYVVNFKGRKLLSSEDKQVVFAYETDDEGLPSSWNKMRRAKPIFVPIDGVENENKPLKKVISMKLRKKLYQSSKDHSDVSDTTVVDEDHSDSFQMKNAYKKFNITSNHDVLNHFKIFKYAFYDMIKEEPRLLSWIYHHDRTECKSDGNLRLNEKVAESIVSKYMRELNKRHGNKYVLKKIVNVEENHDVIKGDRYLIELDLKVKGQGDRSFRLSRYVYQKVGDMNLCEPTGFQWNRHTTVHVIVPVKNQGRWVQHFIDNMEQIYLETLDSHLNVIIVDFNSTDIDIEKSLKNSKLKRYKFIKLKGPFQRALGIQAGADSVKNPHDIIFTCDLHLEIPSALIDSIRKHCVEGKMAFAPIVVRLDCGRLPDNPYGLWELQGYGLFAICKSDFENAGGMNTKEFKTKWGGEDWEMLDRILSNKLEVERLRVPKFYHYYHSKVGMWSKT